MELVRRAFEAFNGGGIEAVLPLFPPDFVWYPTDRWLEGSAYRGHDGRRRLATAVSDNFGSWAFEVHRDA